MAVWLEGIEISEQAVSGLTESCPARKIADGVEPDVVDIAQDEIANGSQ